MPRSLPDRDLLSRPELLAAADHDRFAGIEPACYGNRSRIVLKDGHRPQADRILRLIDDPDRRLARRRLEQGGGREIDDRLRRQFGPPDDRRSQQESRRRIGQCDLDRVGPGNRIDPWRNLANGTVGDKVLVADKADFHLRQVRLSPVDPETGSRNLKHGFPLVRVGQPHHHLAGRHHLPRLRRLGRDDPGAVGTQLGVGQRVLGRIQLCLGSGQFGLCLGIAPLGIVVLDPCRIAIGEKFALALRLRPALLDRCLCRRKIGLGGLQGIQLVLVVQPGEQIALGNLISNVHGAFGDLASHAESQIAFTARPDFAR